MVTLGYTALPDKQFEILNHRFLPGGCLYASAGISGELYIEPQMYKRKADFQLGENVKVLKPEF